MYCYKVSLVESALMSRNNFDLPKGTFARRVAATGLLAAGGRGGSPKTALMAHTHTHTEPPYPEQG